MQFQLQVLGKLVEGYQSMTPMLRKVEEAISGTNGGRSTNLVTYYAHWERAVFHALNAMVLHGMRSLTAMLSDRAQDGVEPSCRQPLFKARDFLKHAHLEFVSGRSYEVRHHVAFEWSEELMSCMQGMSNAAGR